MGLKIIEKKRAEIVFMVMEAKIK